MRAPELHESLLPPDASGVAPCLESFPVASLVPEPGTGLLVMTGLLGLAVTRRRAGVRARSARLVHAVG